MPPYRLVANHGCALGCNDIGHHLVREARFTGQTSGGMRL